MSYCAPCQKLKSISLCTDSVIIGKAPLANAPYVVNFKSLATGAIYTYHVTSSATKYLTLIFTDGFPLATETAYEMWINLSGDSIDTQLDLIIGTTTDTCYNISGISVFDIYYDENENFSSQTLEVID
jgi:hypothetical protein